MVSVLTSSVVDCVPVVSNLNTASPLITQLIGVRVKIDWLEVMTLCLSEVITRATQSVGYPLA